MLRLIHVLKLGVAGLLLSIPPNLNACTIFMANDGQHIWIGNNEDEVQNKNYRIWYYPAQKNNYGYAIWTELSFGKLLNGFSWLNPQGGLNEHGLFMDYTAIDPIEIQKDSQKQDRKKQVVTGLLKKYKTVDEVLTHLKKYNLVKLKTVQLFIGDATGNYAIVTGGYIVPKTSTNFALTNYCINKGHTEACHRRDAAIHFLNTSSGFQLTDITQILEKSAQKTPNNVISNYSMAIDLKSRTIYLYYKNDFATVSVISLSEALKKGKHHRNLENYFPGSIAPLLETVCKKSGLRTAIEQYRTLRKKSDGQYNFNNADALHLAIRWMDKGETTNAIQLLKCLREFETASGTIDSWLGVANRKAGNPETSDSFFVKVLEQKPNDYLATLWGRQVNQNVIFKLADFEEAKQLSLIGDFTQWTKHPVAMKKENGYWTCAITLPKGEHRYKFVVNGQYLADHLNYLHTGTGPDIFSKLYVW